MICPLCTRPLVKRYRKIEMVRRSPCYRPLWWCEHDEVAVEINRPTGELLAERPPRTERRPRPGSASE